jgi:hypothetical protein
MSLQEGVQCLRRRSGQATSSTWMASKKAQALIGFQGRGLDDVVPPDFYHDLFLKAIIFQWP